VVRRGNDDLSAAVEPFLKKSSLPFRLKRAFFLTYLRALNLFLTLGRLTAKIGLVIDEMKNLSKTDLRIGVK